MSETKITPEDIALIAEQAWDDKTLINGVPIDILTLCYDLVIAISEDRCLDPKLCVDEICRRRR